MVLLGPDLNGSRPPFDKKQYRQILLPNGLRAVLICDVVAMNESMNNGGVYISNGDDESDSGDEGESGDVGYAKQKDYTEMTPDDFSESTVDGEEGDSDDDDDDDDGLAAGGLREAAAAMVVGVGSTYDPPECPGLAHFLEHLLFMGSAKYPDENAFDAFVSKHSGSNNAFTELEQTVFHFELPQEYLMDGLDRFAQFFACPLLRDSSADRELANVESEFQLVKNSDSSRVQQLMSHTCGRTPEEHPFAKFAWGNEKSLKEEPMKLGLDNMTLLRAFYDKHYYASNMRLVVVGGFDLDTLQEAVLKSFGDIPSVPKSMTEEQFKKTNPCSDASSWESVYRSPIASLGMPLAESCLYNRVFYIAPVKDRHMLSITFQLPPQINSWKTKPCDYIAHLIGHEAQGSVLATLKEKSWATGCSAGVGSDGYENSSSHSLFIVSFTLSLSGVDHWKVIVSEVYRYIGMLRHHCREGLPKWIFDEIKSIHDVAHRYGDEESPEDLVESLAEEMSPHFNTPPERLLDASALIFEYDPVAIQELIDTHLTPRNARIDLMTSKFGKAADYENIESDFNKDLSVQPPTDTLFDPVGNSIPFQTEPYFGTRYWCQEIEEKTLKEWEVLSQPQVPSPPSILSLPPQNPYIPDSFDLKPLPATDSLHPLLNCSLKLQISVGRKKQWFPATVTQYDSNKGKLLLSYEDEDEKWHKVDKSISELEGADLAAGYESTMDNKSIRYRIVALAMEGMGAIRMYGDESDFDVDDGKGFPPIPPKLGESRLPKAILNTQVLKLWHLQDRDFRRPVADLRMQVNCANANRTPFDAACAELFIRIFADALTETAYLASMSEIGSSTSSNDSGFYFRVHGFDSKLLKLFQVMLDMLGSFRSRSESDGLPDTIKSGRFEACLESYTRALSNTGMQASKLTSQVRLECLRTTCWSSREKLAAVTGVEVGKFVSTISMILSKIGIEALYHGNVDTADAENVKKAILKMVEESGGGGLPRKKYPALLVTKIPFTPQKLTLPSKDPSDTNTAVEIYFQIGKDTIFERVMTDLLTEILYEPLFDQLRTKEQFGYQVSCDSRWTNGVMGFHFMVVTSSKSAAESTQRIDQFLREFRKEIVDMSQDDFMEHLCGLAVQKLEMFNSMSEETSHLWGEIRDGKYEWQCSRDEAICLRSMTKAQALEHYDKWLNPDSKRRMLIVEVISHEGDACEGCPKVDDVDAFIGNQVESFHKACKTQTWGKIY